VGRAPQVNHLGVDGEVFRPAAPDAELAARAGIEPGDEVLVSAVRLVGLKGVQRVIRAVAALAPARPRLKYLVAGEGPYRPELERLIAASGLSTRVSLLGFLPQERLAGFYALGSLAVFPSTGEEALGLSIAEAMACGLPVLASRLGGVPEVVGEDGALVPPGDDQALAIAIAGLLDDPARRADLAQRGRARVLKEFSWSACAERLERGLA
jgi:glycosyltransferase involved in cell wall biosynthesis